MVRFAAHFGEVFRRGFLIMNENTEEKITIIEGPSPTFEQIPELWVHGLSEGAMQSEMVMTRLRTFNGPSLVERCKRAWRNQRDIQLEYRTPDGLNAEISIIAARNMETDEGDMLLLWLRRPDDSVELEIGYGDGFEDDEDDWDPDVM
jgi:hypothetical protein